MKPNGCAVRAKPDGILHARSWRTATVHFDSVMLISTVAVWRAREPRLFSLFLFPRACSGPVQQASLAAAIRISLNPFESNLQSKGNQE